MNDFDRQFFTFLQPLISDHKKELFQKVIAERTKHLTVVLEGVHKDHNASAVVRTAECLGIQDVHLISGSYETSSHITSGAGKWMSLHQHNPNKEGLKNVIGSLKKKGYKIYATTPRSNSMPIEDVPVKQKMALIFGNELEGISNEAITLSDATFHIPMTGFTESLNLSVSVAICLHQLLSRIRASGIDWKLTYEEREQILLEWLKRSVKNIDIVEQEFRKYFSKLQK